MAKRSPFSVPTRRAFLAGSAAAIGGPALGQASDPGALDPETAAVLYPEPEPEPAVPRNISSFRAMDWRPHFSSLRNGAILVDTQSRALHYWSEGESVYKLYPSSVPLTEDLTRRGRTSVIQKVVGPSWAPTPSMKKRNPEWPDYIPPGPNNPLGTHALYLGWKYYRIHGTHDTRKIGRRSSNGCIGLYNEQIADLFSMAKVGTQVLLI
ncbi:L,D-transpeptidase [Marinibacterium profundimaris]|uniref:ErfK/YbiS/YcfS/YnhG family protein n=1 Tax=Marinibacterium profundimaris TaxID=1679460 RepID=A0A225NMY9_9RHOB|nr:L,D-transpeptidase [Marinibacterium profundimaris]OWU75763.1 ErfK/YbiS/YcfS/YnhG family protein [Marinibacterium profundimaris]